MIGIPMAYPEQAKMQRKETKYMRMDVKKYKQNSNNINMHSG